MSSKHLQQLLLIAGMILVAGSLLPRVLGRLQAQAAVKSFLEKTADRNAEGRSAHGSHSPLSAAVRQVSSERRDVSGQIYEPIGVLRIPRISLEVPVFNGTESAVLDRGVGRIPGTAKLGQLGNIAIAGHRDTFFRGLKELGVGDVVELEGVDGVTSYRVDRIRIVQPEDTSVLESGKAAALTLVTCYPFSYIGNAPERYVMHAAAFALTQYPAEARSISSQSELKGESQ